MFVHNREVRTLWIEPNIFITISNHRPYLNHFPHYPTVGRRSADNSWPVLLRTTYEACLVQHGDPVIIRHPTVVLFAETCLVIGGMFAAKGSEDSRAVWGYIGL